MAPSKRNPKAKSKSKKALSTSPDPSDLPFPGNIQETPQATTPPPLFTITALQLVGPEYSQSYVVRPTQIWDSLTRFAECIIKDKTKKLNFKLSMHDDISLSRPNHPGIWYARILEIRGQDPSHVYLRVFWYYKEPQLPSAMRGTIWGAMCSSKAEYELVASNDMEIVSAMSVIGKVKIKHVSEDEDCKWEDYECTGRLWFSRGYDLTGGPDHADHGLVTRQVF